MRSPLVVALVAAALATALAAPSAIHAQRSFEGIVTMRMTDSESGKTGTMKYSVKGQKIRVDMGAEGQGMAMILDAGTSRGTMLMPAMQSYMEMDMSSATDADAKASVTRTGRKDRVAGHACEIIVVADEQKNESEVCGATDMGRFFMGGSRGKTPAWARGLENFFPLRVSTKTGPVLEVTKIEPRALDAALFAVPTGWKSMGNMGRPK
jgi:hypothetical protein